MTDSIHLVGPSTSPGAAKLTPTAINLEVNQALFSNAAPRLSSTGIIVPYYFYTNSPYTDPVFQSLITLIRQYHQVPVIVVLNQPGTGGLGGPGPYDGNIAAAIRLLKGAGAKVLGYVDTAYGARAASLVSADIALWSTLYAPTRPDGIFFDEMPYALGTGNANVTLYASFYVTAQAYGFYPVVANPGSDQQPAWYAARVADIIIINENTTWPSAAVVAGATVDGHGDYDFRLNAVLVYAQATFNRTAFQAIQPYVQWVYSSDRTMPNPWAGLPTYLAQLFEACGGAENVVGSTTNDNAQPGSVGEVISSTVLTASAVALTSATAANVTSISLTSGDWDVRGSVVFKPAATTSVTAMLGGIGTVTATLPSQTAGAYFGTYQAALVPGAVTPAYATGTTRISIAATTTVYLVAQATFTVSTMGAFGFIAARRVR